LWVATVGLVCNFFLKGVVFLSGHGRGQWVFSEQSMLAMRVGAGCGTAGLAQLGIVVFVVVVVLGNLQGLVVGAGWLSAQCVDPGTICG